MHHRKLVGQRDHSLCPVFCVDVCAINHARDRTSVAAARLSLSNHALASARGPFVHCPPDGSTTLAHPGPSHEISSRPSTLPPPFAYSPHARDSVSASAPPNGSGPGPAPEHEAVPISMTGNPAPAPDAASAPLHIPASSSDASLPSSID